MVFQRRFNYRQLHFFLLQIMQAQPQFLTCFWHILINQIGLVILKGKRLAQLDDMSEYNNICQGRSEIGDGLYDVPTVKDVSSTPDEANVSCDQSNSHEHFVLCHLGAFLQRQIFLLSKLNHLPVFVLPLLFDERQGLPFALRVQDGLHKNILNLFGLDLQFWIFRLGTILGLHPYINPLDICFNFPLHEYWKLQLFQVLLQLFGLLILFFMHHHLMQLSFNSCLGCAIEQNKILIHQGLQRRGFRYLHSLFIVKLNQPKSTLAFGILYYVANSSFNSPKFLVASKTTLSPSY